MQEVCGMPSAAAVRAALADLADLALILAIDAEAIGQVGAWQTSAAAQFQAEMHELSASLRGWSDAASGLRAELAMVGLPLTRLV